MAKILKICGLAWENASRDKRELSAYRELGHDVLVMAKGNPEDRGREDEVDGFRVLRYSTRPLGERFPTALNRFVSVFLWAVWAKKLHPDFISGHDLIPGLTVAWLSTCFSRHKPKLIYDAHEFEIGQNPERCRLRARNILIWERFLIGRCAFSIMVNDAIADEVKRIHHLETRPVVVRNTPSCWVLDPESIAEQRHAFLQEFAQRGEAVSFLIMYHGMVSSGRGIEVIIQALARLENVGLIILGNGEQDYLASLRSLAASCGVESRVIFHPAVPLDELRNYVGAMDLSVMMLQPSCKNHYYALPNKFFESIQSMTPILAPDFLEQKRLIDRYKIGLTCCPTDPEAVSAGIARMRDDEDFYALCKKNLVKAKQDLCWENEKHVLMDAFSKATENM